MNLGGYPVSYSYGQQYTQPRTTTFYNVQSEEEAYRYNVPPNTTGNFINENQGCLYRKTVGVSILEPPVFEVYDIVKRNVPIEQPVKQAQPDMSEYITKTEFEAYKTIIDDMQKIVKELNGDG